MSKKCLVWVWKKGAWNPKTNLSLSITGANSFVEWANTQYTASLVLTWFIGSPTTVLTVTLPAWITYLSSSDSWSESSWVITWTLWDLMANKSVTFTVTSEDPAAWYEITWAVVSDFGNIWTATASKDIEVEAAPAWIALRITSENLIAIWFTTVSNLTITTLTVWWVDKLSEFTLWFSTISTGTNAVIEIWTLDGSVTSWDMYVWWTIQYDWEYTYNWSNASEYVWPFSYTKADPSLIPVADPSP